MGLRRDSAVALYDQIAASLARDIARQRYKPLERLPTEEEIGKRYGVSRITVRNAIARLAERGLVVSRQGKGTFVAGPVVQHPLEQLQGFYDALVGQGHEPETRLLEFGPRAAPGDVSSVLGCGAGSEPIYLERCYFMRGSPFALARAWLTPAARGVSWAQAERHPIYAILRDLLGCKVERAEAGIVAREADAREVEMLRLRERSPVLVMERVSYSADGQALETSRFSVRPESYRFRIATHGPLAITRQIEHIAGRGAPGRKRTSTNS